MCLLVVLLISVMMLHSIECSLCAKWKKIGFKTKDDCLNRYKGMLNNGPSRRFLGILDALADTMMAPIDIAGNLLGDMAAAATGVAAEAAFGYLFKDKLRHSSQQLKSKNIKWDEIRKEAGFDLTKEEMAKFKVWDKGVVPYFIDEFSFDKVLRDRIRSILDQINAATNLEFVEIPRPPLDDQTRYVFFINRRGILLCVDHTINNFTNQGIQRVILGYDCIDLQNGMAGLIMTLLGIPPQHNAPNRNHYIEIVEENILPDKKEYFTALKNNDWLFHDIKYDFESASHYPNHKYSAWGGSTIRPKLQFHMLQNTPMGEGRSFSSTDLMKIGMLYNYIIATRRDHKTDCSQLFQSSAGSNVKRPRKNRPQPRHKPDKYFKPDNHTNEGGNDKLKLNSKLTVAVDSAAHQLAAKKEMRLADKKRIENVQHVLQNFSDFKSDE